VQLSASQRHDEQPLLKIEGANHFFDNHEQDVLDSVEAYVQKRSMGPKEGR
jgi:alpha/beta superfamily hydrolase